MCAKLHSNTVGIIFRSFLSFGISINILSILYNAFVVFCIVRKFYNFWSKAIKLSRKKKTKCYTFFKHIRTWLAENYFGIELNWRRMRKQFRDFIHLSHILHVPTIGELAKCSVLTQLSTQTRIWMMRWWIHQHSTNQLCYHLVELKDVFVLCMSRIPTYNMYDIRAQIFNI